MQEFHDLYKQIETEKTKLETILLSGIKKLENEGLNTAKFDNTIFYYCSYSGDTEENNEYAYVQRMLYTHTLEDMVIKKHDGFKIWNYDELETLLIKWLNSLSIKEELTAKEIKNETSRAKTYFLEVLKDYELTNTDKEYFIANFNDNIKVITKEHRQERREHGEKVLDGNWITAIINIQAKLDFEEKLDELADEGYLEEDNPIWNISRKYDDLIK